MKKYLAIAVVCGGLLAGVAVAQNKVFSTAPNQNSFYSALLETQIEFLQRELEFFLRRLYEIKPTVDAMAACQAAGKIYAPGAAGMGVSPAGCVTLTGVPLVSEIKSTTGTDDGQMNVGTGTTATARMQDFINSSGCLTSEGWHPCSDDEVIFALDQEVTGASPPTNIVNGNTYWVRSLFPKRFQQETLASNTPTTLNCAGWNSTTVPAGPPYATVGTMFNGSTTAPKFQFGLCNVARRVLCCR